MKASASRLIPEATTLRAVSRPKCVSNFYSNSPLSMNIMSATCPSTVATAPMNMSSMSLKRMVTFEVIIYYMVRTFTELTYNALGQYL